MGCSICILNYKFLMMPPSTTWPFLTPYTERSRPYRYALRSPRTTFHLLNGSPPTLSTSGFIVRTTTGWWWSYAFPLSIVYGTDDHRGTTYNCLVVLKKLRSSNNASLNSYAPSKGVSIKTKTCSCGCGVTERWKLYYDEHLHDLEKVHIREL